MVNYSLSHLTQNKDQFVGGPIQDDEALLLFSLIKVCRINKILECGGLQGYSATNFLSAIEGKGLVITIDTNPVEKISENHIVVQKDVKEVTQEDIGIDSLDLVFFDAHDYNSQISFFERMLECRVINDDTFIALHDTNLHPQKFAPWSYPISYDEQSGWVHQSSERMMANTLAYQYGFHVLNFHTKIQCHNEDLPARHGLTIAKRFKALKV